MEGYIKSYRKMFDNPVVTKDAEHLAVWIYLLHYATHTGYDILFGGERITLKPGQLITSRGSIARKLSVSESKVQRILKTFEIEQQIEQVMDNRSRLISLINWGKYQNIEQQSEQQVNSNRTASEQQVNTHNNVYINDSINDGTNDNNENTNNTLSGKPDKYPAEVYQDIINYLNLKTDKNFRWRTNETIRLINGRLDDGYVFDDFKQVIDVKVADWKNDNQMNKFLRPSTLFRPSNFESYLNEKKSKTMEDHNKELESWK